MEVHTKDMMTIFTCMAMTLLLDTIFAQDRIEKKCNPSILHRFENCPEGYCCVRDEFLPTYVYCRKIGLEYENCATRDLDSECPCAKGLYCKPNIASQFQSLYGRCYNASKDATTTITTTPTTTTTMMTSPNIVTSDPTVATTETTVPVVVTQNQNAQKMDTTMPPFPFLPIVGKR